MPRRQNTIRIDVRPHFLQNLHLQIIGVEKTMPHVQHQSHGQTGAQNFPQLREHPKKTVVG